MANRNIPWGTKGAFCDDGEFGDGFWRIYTREPCWPADGNDTWLFNGGPAFDTQEHAEKYLSRLQHEEL